MQPASRPERLAPLRRDEQVAGTFGIRTARSAHRASAPAVSPWRLPRVRSLLALVFLATFAALVAGVARVYTDLLWFQELGHERVLWTTLKWKILAHGLPAFGTASFVLLNLAVVERVVASHAPIRPYRRLAYPLAAVAAGLISSEWRTHAAWHLLALWSGRGDFGARDPLFHRDIGFFVFSLPLYQQAARWALDAVVMGGVGTTAAYAAAGALRHARAHLLTLAALALVVLAWRYRLEQFALALPHEGSIVPGASYSDAHVRLPASRVLAFGCLGGAPLCLYAARRRVPRAATVAVATLAVLAVAADHVLPRVIQGVYVEPQQLSREKPYVADAIASTRRAFALTDVSVRAIPARSRPFAQQIAANRRTIANVSLWDASVLRPMLNDQASIGRYYSFLRTTVDRYTVDGVPRLVALAARHLDRRRVAPDTRSWANDRFAYTHGYGIVAVPVGAVDGGGHPRLIARDFESAHGALGVREPRTYFAEQRDRDPPYVIASSRRGEIDQPIPGSRAPGYHYDGDGGIALSSPLRRIAFAARFGDLKLLLTETVTDRSRIILHRNAGERLLAVAPFLRWDTRAQTAIIDGRVQYLFHGYTTSTHYPYSASVRMGETRVNYARASAQAAVDAFSGRVSIYAVDPSDPILRAWLSAFPGLFLPASQMPDEMREHLRYPEQLFNAQARAYATYHASDPTGFWNGADAWQLPQQLAGPVEVAGEIHFPDPKKRVDRDGDDPPGRWRMQPAYLYARLPGDTSERLVLVTPFTPRGRQNLAGYMAGSIDDAGRPRLTVLSLPRDRLTTGPTQATRRVLASPAVSRRLELLNRESRDLGSGAVNRTILGDPRSVPIGDTLVHVQPIYLVAGGSGVPRLQLVTAYADGRVGYGRDLTAALRRIVEP
ncbi:MAG TPA: UPF0182 family protein [Solirubrobacteraceae bacterium]|nr:UPF0182 family protein [Solirubrobacteraceae bacterium]